MSSTGTSPTAPELFHQLLTELGGDLFTSGSGLLVQLFTNIQKNPTTQNVIAQGVILAASAPMQLPNLEQAAIGQTATVGLQLLALAKAPMA